MQINLEVIYKNKVLILGDLKKEIVQFRLDYSQDIFIKNV